MPIEGPIKPFSVGKVMPNQRIRIADEEGRDVPAGAEGEVLVQGPNVCRGYYGQPEATRTALAGGWLHTGDVAVSDRDGFLSIVDRKKDMIRSGGQNVFSKEVEDCLAQHPAVEQVAVIGLPDPVYEESVCAVVVRRRDDGSSPDPAVRLSDEELGPVLQAWVRERLAGYNTPRAVIVVDELPATTMGKTIKGELRTRFGSLFARPAHGG
jgi:fatty-acyl-CoA synthase